MPYGTREIDLHPGVNPFMKQAMLWRAEEEGILLCELCPRHCRIPHRKTGFCGTRYSFDGKLWAINYGLVSSAHMDPYSKKPLYHFHPGKMVLSLGSYGCNMACKHCQNCEISQQKITQLHTEHEYYSPEDILKLCRMHKADGVSFTYNEPAIWMEYAVDCCKLLKEEAYYTSFVTNGYMSAGALEAVGANLDAANVDVKGFKDETYKNLSSVDNWREVLARCEEMTSDWGVHIEITTNVVPEYNDDDRTFRGIADWIVSELGEKTPWHITRYHPAHKMYSQPTPLETLLRAREIGRAAGLKFVYLGNTSDPEGDGTKCPGCGKTVIERMGFFTSEAKVKDGKCALCGYDLGIKE